MTQVYRSAVATVGNVFITASAKRLYCLTRLLSVTLKGTGVVRTNPTFAPVDNSMEAIERRFSVYSSGSTYSSGYLPLKFMSCIPKLKMITSYVVGSNMEVCRNMSRHCKPYLESRAPPSVTSQGAC